MAGVRRSLRHGVPYRLTGGLVALALTLTAPATADQTAPGSWTDRKCTLYRHAVEDAFALLGRDGITDAFMDENDAFIANGCVARGGVCPRSEQDIAMANLLTTMTMNEGMASTFVPFDCPD